MQVIFWAAPQWQRRSPITIARYRPIDVVLEPITEATSLDGLRMPIGLSILSEQLIFYSRGADIPRRLRVIHQRGVAAPAVRVGVLELELAEENAA